MKLIKNIGKTVNPLFSVLWLCTKYQMLKQLQILLVKGTYCSSNTLSHLVSIALGSVSLESYFHNTVENSPKRQH